MRAVDNIALIFGRCCALLRVGYVQSVYAREIIDFYVFGSDAFLQINTCQYINTCSFPVNRKPQVMNSYENSTPVPTRMKTQ